MEHYLGDLKKSQSAYKMVTGVSGKASDCVQCGQCGEQCPQHIKVMEKLNEIAGVLE